MPYDVIEAETLAPQVRRLVVRASHVTRHCKPGQFVIVRVSGDGERIPLTIASSDRAAGTITLIAQAIGATTRDLCAKSAGDVIEDVAGPMGCPTHMENAGHAVIVGGGVGTAVIYPQAVGLKGAGNRVTAIVGGRSREYVILEKELGAVCDEVLACTDDGSHGFKGFVTQRLEKLIADAEAAGGGGAVKLVLAAGPVPMMRAVAEVTRARGIKTLASLNPIMVDGTGMCGGCRVQVGGEMKFACVDGPEFDAHKVDFRELSDRLTAYREQEKRALERRECKTEVRS